jgi:monovalent cation:H+ antiporter-2, CPA2 family
MEPLAQVLVLLGVAVAVVLAFQRLHVPASLGYLLVGILVGPHTWGPVVDIPQIGVLAEFGIVFLLFTIGLNYSLPQLHALRNQVLLLGTGQVALTTLAVGLLAWFAGSTIAAAFVIGAVFAQSSTTIISRQLSEQREEHSRHGRLALAMSVFQDVTAVPFVVVIPALGVAAGVGSVAGSLGYALGKAILAFALVFFVGRWLLRPLFRLVAAGRSAEVFTLTVLLVSLLAAWTTNSLGLSLAFGAFLAGMMLGETEFRHQVESAIRPFRDVLLGLFFVGIGMLFDPLTVLQVWHWALVGAVMLLSIKTLLVALIVRWAGIDPLTAFRTGLLLAVGGEFGFALLAIALGAGAIDTHSGQIALTSVLFSMMVSPFVIRYNHAIARRLVLRPAPDDDRPAPRPGPDRTDRLHGHVIICGYGRIGQGVAHFLAQERIPFVALDLDISRVRDAHAAGEPVFYGDSADRNTLDALALDRARLVVISHGDVAAALQALRHLRASRPDLPVMVRTPDDAHVEELHAAGAVEVVPETLEASLVIASQALLLLGVPQSVILRRMQEQRSGRYSLLREMFRGDVLADHPDERSVERLHSVTLPPDSPAAGRALQDFRFERVTVSALVRDGERRSEPPGETRLEAGDVVVLFGTDDDLLKAEQLLVGLR